MQGDFAAAIVTEAEGGVRTVHGRPFCYALGVEDDRPSALEIEKLRFHGQGRLLLSCISVFLD
jgi:hypothetical protein